MLNEFREMQNEVIGSMWQQRINAVAFHPSLPSAFICVCYALRVHLWLKFFHPTPEALIPHNWNRPLFSAFLSAASAPPRFDQNPETTLRFLSDLCAFEVQISAKRNMHKFQSSASRDPTRCLTCSRCILIPPPLHTLFSITPLCYGHSTSARCVQNRDPSLSEAGH
jgi:hypothetical protein